MSKFGLEFLSNFQLELTGSFIGIPTGIKTIKHLKNNFTVLIYFDFVTFLFILMFYKMITYIG